MYCSECGEVLDECGGCDAMICPDCDADHECYFFAPEDDPKDKE